LLADSLPCSTNFLVKTCLALISGLKSKLESKIWASLNLAIASLSFPSCANLFPDSIKSSVVLCTNF